MCLPCRRAAWAKECAECGGAIPSPDGVKRTCSTTCARRPGARALNATRAVPDARATSRRSAGIRRQRIRETQVEVVDRLAVFERDGYLCHLCELPIDRALDGNHPRGATLDHVIPLVHGGEHSYRNVAAAHRACNIRKGIGVAA